MNTVQSNTNTRMMWIAVGLVLLTTLSYILMPKLDKNLSTSSRSRRRAISPSDCSCCYSTAGCCS